jgi:heptosyltransferase-2/heptosyltransferase-3
MWRTVRLLREHNFDLAIDFQRKFRTSLLAYFGDAKCRVGYHQPNGLLCTVRVPDSVNKHAIDRYFDLLHAVGILATDPTLELFLMAAEHNYAHEALVARGVKSDGLKVGLFPGAGWKLREWMPDRFAALGDRATEHFDAEVLIFGGPDERELVDQVSSLMKTEPISFAGDLRIRQLAAFIACCDLFITNDTGPMHIAAAVHTPTIALFGPGNHIRFQPVDSTHTTIRHPVPCNPCKQFTDTCKDNICMKLITVDEVWDTVCRKLNPQI